MPADGPELVSGDVLEVRAICYANGHTQVGVNVRHYIVAGAGPPGSGIRDVSRVLGTILGPLYQAILAEDSEFLGVSTRVILPEVSGAYSIDAGAGVGTVAGDTLPTGTCGLIRFIGEGTDRASRGRIYLPFPPEANNANGYPDGTYVNLASAVGDAWADEQQVDTVLEDGTALIRPIIFSPASPTGIPFANSWYTYVTNFGVQEQWATQRRRSGFGPTNPKPLL